MTLDPTLASLVNVVGRIRRNVHVDESRRTTFVDDPRQLRAIAVVNVYALARRIATAIFRIALSGLTYDGVIGTTGEGIACGYGRMRWDGSDVE